MAQVGNYYLYQEDIALLLPYGVSVEDSIEFVRDFTRKWLEEQVLYEKAEHNIRGDERIERMVEEYRRTLVLNRYEQLLIAQRMSEELTEAAKRMGIWMQVF